MDKEEYSALKPGDKVWCFNIEFNRTLYGTLSVGLIAELEKTKNKDEFRVIQVKKGTSTKAGKTLIVGVWGAKVKCLFKDYNEGVQYWNSFVYNEVDRLTQYFEESVKRVKGKLLKPIKV